tara:strand:+ start:7178 stop:7465 length:288 start_codon:yes stop_codon:yes gene_type:complete
MVTFFMLFAFLWWGIQRYTAMKRGLVVRTAQAKIEKEYQEAIRAAAMKSEVAEIKKKYKSDQEKLNKASQEIDEAAKGGPVGVANAWAEYLGVKK